MSQIGKLRRFGLVMAAALAVLGGLLLWRQKPAAPVLLGFSGAFLLAALLAPRFLWPVERAWMKFAGWISVVMTHVILTLTFFLVITPVGAIMRLFGKDFLGLKIQRDSRTYWAPVDPHGPTSRSDTPY